MTLPLYIYIYMFYNRTHIMNAYIYVYIYINTELLDGNQGHQEETHHPTHRFRRLFLDLLSIGWRGCASAMGAIKPPPTCSSPNIIVSLLTHICFTFNSHDMKSICVCLCEYFLAKNRDVSCSSAHWSKV